MGPGFTLTLTRTYDAGRESGERQLSVRRASFVRAHWFSYAGRTDPKDFDRHHIN